MVCNKYYQTKRELYSDWKSELFGRGLFVAEALAQSYRPDNNKSIYNNSH